MITLSARVVMTALLSLFYGLSLSAQNLAWTLAAGGTASDEGRAIAVDADGSVVVAGVFGGTVDFDPGPGMVSLTSPGFSNIFLAKYTPAGSLLWVRQLVSNGIEDATAVAIAPDGAIYLAGYFLGIVDFDPAAGTATRNSGGSFDGFLARYDAAGALEWVRAIGGPMFDDALSIGVDAAGFAVVGGSFTGTATFETGGTAAVARTAVGEFDAWLARYSPTGELAWVAQLGGPAFDRLVQLAVDSLGNTFVTGYFSETVDFDPGPGVAALPSNGDTDIFIARYDDAGALAWVRGVGETGHEEPRGLDIDDAGAVYLTGGFSGTIDFDPGPGVHLLTDAGISDVFMARYDADGAFEWARAIGGPDSEFGTCIRAAADGSVYVGGQFLISLDFDPAPAEAVRTSRGDFDVFLAHYTASGDLSWVRQGGSAGLDEVRSLYLDAAGNLYATGFYKNGAADFEDAGGQLSTLPEAAGRDLFVVKYANPTTGTDAGAARDVISVFPVPATRELSVHCADATAPARLVIYDAAGRTRRVIESAGPRTVIPVADLEAGLYWLEVSDGRRRRTVAFSKL